MANLTYEIEGAMWVVDAGGVAVAVRLIREDHHHHVLRHATMTLRNLARHPSICPEREGKGEGWFTATAMSPLLELCKSSADSCVLLHATEGLSNMMKGMSMIDIARSGTLQVQRMCVGAVCVCRYSVCV
jgi:hypothetical protein